MVMLKRVVMVIAVKPVIKAMSFVWLEREEKERVNRNIEIQR